MQESPFPEVHDIAKEMAAKYKDDIPLGVRETRKKAQKLAVWPEYIDDLLDKALRLMVSNCRHATNGKIRKAAGVYGGPAKVTVSKATSGAAATVYEYMIAGRTLGSLYGEELVPLAKSQEAQGRGCLTNGKILRALRPLVKDGASVESSVSQKKLMELMKKKQAA